MEDGTHGAGLPFWKYHGTGNDFVMLDNRNEQLTNCITSGLARRLCDRHLGVGGDGMIVLERTGSGSSDDGYDFRMRYFNSDGSVGALCGNGARCAVAFALELGVQPGSGGHWRFLDGDQRFLEGFLTGGPASKGVTQIGVRMPDIDRIQVVDTSGYFVNTGCPHFVVYVENEAVLDRMDVSTSGSALRHDARFRAIGGVNVDFVCTRADDSNAEVIRVRTFERGVEAETLSCGTGAVAVAVVDLYSKFAVTPKVSADNVISCDVNSDNGVADSAESGKHSVNPIGDVVRLYVAPTADVIDTESDATSIGSDVRAAGREVDVECADREGPLSSGSGWFGTYERYVESRGGRLRVRVDCQRDKTTDSLVFRNVLLSGPTTKVFFGTFFQG